MEKDHLSKLISLTFDEDPEVRKNAAKELGKYDDPGAVFALYELLYDNDEEVRKVARQILDKGKERSETWMSFSEIFGTVQKSEANEKEVKKRVIEPIERIFEKHFGKGRGEEIKKRLMPSIENIYKRPSEDQEMEAEERKERIQKFLSAYLEAISTIDKSKEEGEEEREKAIIKELEDVAQITSGETPAEIIDKYLEEGEAEEGESEEELLKSLPESLFKKAYEIMLYSDGDEAIMKTEMKRMVKQAERDIKLAFRLARERFRKNKITKLVDIKPKMRNITTGDLTIIETSVVEFKGRKKRVAVRLLVEDEYGSQGVVYLFDESKKYLSKGMKIKIEKAHCKEINGETCLVLSKGGRVYIVI